MSFSPSLWRNNSKRYGNISRLLHWVIAIFIFTMLGLGWAMDIIPKEWKPTAMGIHKSLGILILALVIMRLCWRFYNAPPPLPSSVQHWEKKISIFAHYLLYGLLLAMPLTGWAMSSAFGKPVMFLGLFPLPELISMDRELGKNLKEMHDTFAYLLAGVIFLHIGAAFYHHFIRKDGILLRMWPIFLKKK